MTVGGTIMSIVVATSHKHWNDFFSLKRTLYRHDPAAVLPLRKMERQQLDLKRNPFYQHASRQAFLCYRNKTPVGRIVAIKDHLHNEYHRDAVGFFGFFETIDDDRVVHALVGAASDWLREQGCDQIRGPVNPSMKSDFGVLIEGNEFSPTIMMGHTPERYDRQLQSAGFSVAKQFYAFEHCFSKTESPEDWQAKFSDLLEAQKKIEARYPQLRLRPVSAKTYAETLREINELGNQVRAEGWGFVPLTTAELEFMIKNLRQVIRFDQIHVAYWDDRLVGYIVNIPDVNWALKRTYGRWDWLRMMQLSRLIKQTPRARVIALGVANEYRSKGVAMMLIQQLVKNYSAYDEWEFSWVQEDNVKSIRAIARAIPLRQYKTYRLYERDL